MLLSSFSFAFDGAFAKVLSQSMDSVEVVFFRNGITMMVVALSIFKLPIKQVGGKPWLLLFRALIGFASMLVFFYNIAHIPLADAITFSRTAPIFTAILFKKVMIYYLLSLSRISTRRIFPLIVFGSSSTNSTTRGYL